MTLAFSKTPKQSAGVWPFQRPKTNQQTYVLFQDFKPISRLMAFEDFNIISEVMVFSKTPPHPAGSSGPGSCAARSCVATGSLCWRRWRRTATRCSTPPRSCCGAVAVRRARRGRCGGPCDSRVRGRPHSGPLQELFLGLGFLHLRFEGYVLLGMDFSKGLGIPGSEQLQTEPRDVL